MQETLVTPMADGAPRRTARLRRAAVVAALALFAAVRVAILAAAMPVYAHLDEDAHFDLVDKYARGAWPRAGADAYDRTTVELGVRFQSGEWVAPVGDGPFDRVLPGMVLDPGLAAREPALRDLLERDPGYRDAMAAHVERQVDALIARSPNYETFQPPGYYGPAALWMVLGRALGASGTSLLLWVRLLGALVAGAAVIATYALARRAVPEPSAVAFAAAALVAFAPQDVLACVNNDVPGVLLAPCAWILAASVGAAARAGGRRSAGFQAAAGVAVAWIVLTKPTSAAAFVAALVGVLPGAFATWRAAGVRGVWRAVGPFVIGIATPLMCWSGYAVVFLGELTGSAHKTHLMRFEPQTWQNVCAHPVATLDGWRVFLGETIPRTWRGELRWEGAELALPWSDGVYIAVTVLGLLAALFGARGPAAGEDRARIARPFGPMLWTAVVGAPLVLLALSLGWNFRRAFWPTPDYPWFTNARLVFASFPALAILICVGATRRIGVRGLWCAVAAVAVTAVASEVWLHLSMLRGPHAVLRMAGF